MIADVLGIFIESADSLAGNFANHLLMKNSLGYLRMYGITILRSEFPGDQSTSKTKKQGGNQPGL
jgi:hypothetical protein